MTIGVVYCAVSESFPGRCKIGKTFRHPATRIAELQKHYRSRHPFTEHSSLLVEHYSRVEWLTHQRLAERREPATEMFRCSPDEAMATIRWAADEALRNPPVFQTRPKARSMTLAKGRGTRPKHDLWWLWLVAGLVLIVVGLRQWKPDIPVWLPTPAFNTLSRLEAASWPGS